MAKDVTEARDARGRKLTPEDVRKHSHPIESKPHGINGEDDGQEVRKPRILRGASLLDYSQRIINERDTLLGYRWLCRGGGAPIIAPSGHGKSVLSVQASIELAIGRRAFNIRAPRPLRSLIIQAEDDEGDTIEMAQIVDHLKLTEEERAMVDQNTWIELVNDLTSFEFLAALDGFLTQRPADLVWINPYTAYLGAEIKDDKANNLFLRTGLNPILTRHNCAAIPIHHTPKTNFRDTSDWKASDWMYAGAGAAAFTNWARAILVIDPTDTPGIINLLRPSVVSGSGGTASSNIGLTAKKRESFFGYQRTKTK